MDADFWHQRWHQGEIGFHLDQVNPLLRRHWQAPAASRVLVPLCGKSRDLLWLRDQGHEVIGVELSALAAHQFFAESGLEPEVETRAHFECWHVPGIEIYCGDFLTLTSELLGTVDAFYDRAALVALPPQMRSDYTHKLMTLAPAAQGLLITLNYPQALVEGPPFAVSDEVVVRLLGGHYCIQSLESGHVEDVPPRFAEAGVGSMAQSAFRLQPEVS